MRYSLLTVVTCAGLGLSGAAWADDDDCYVSMSDWQPRGAVLNLAEQNGWTVRRIKVDDGCYEIKGRDAEGREIEVKIDPGTLAVREFEYEDDDDDDDDDDNRRGQRGDMKSAPTGQTPDNGLFNSGSVSK